MFAFQDTRAAVQVAFTDRHGGVSGGPYASLNLAANGEHEDVVSENVDLAAYAFARGYADPGDPFHLPTGTPVPVVVGMRQVHGADVHVVTPTGLARAADLPTADALVTTERGIVLMVRVADCAPVLLADVDRGVVGAVHAGRPGLAAGVVPHALAAMRNLGAERVVAWVGPHVCGRCYEVPGQMRAEVTALVPEAFAETSWGTPALDIGAGVRAQLRAEDVEVVDASRCTMEDDDLYSYRRQGAASGRFAGLVWIRP